MRLGASIKARYFCQIALTLDGRHAKAFARLEEVRTADKVYEADVLDPHNEALTRAKRLNGEGKYREGLAAARDAAAIAKRGRDHVLHAKALSVMAHHTEKAAVRGEATKEDATEPALAVLDVCRPLAGKPDYLLTNASTGVMPRIEMDTVEAKAWLLLAKVNLESGPGHAACRQKLQEHALRLFASVEAALPPDGEMVGEYADYVADQCANSYELLVRACMMGGDWASAVATGGEILELVRRFQHRCSPSPRAHLCMVLMSVAECIAHGRKAYGFVTCTRIMHFAIAQAKEKGDLEAQADALQALLTVTRSGTDRLAAGWEGPFSSPRQDGPEGARILHELLDVLRQMGRSVADCAIGLLPLDPADPSHPIDVLDCTHPYHQACVRMHIRRRLHDRGGSVCPTCRNPIRLMSVSLGDEEQPDLQMLPNYFH